MFKNTTVAAVVCTLTVLLLASACDRTVSTTQQIQQPAACFDCHSDQNTVLTSAEGQWNYSVHASGDNIDRNATLFGAKCQVCHTSQGFVALVTGATVPDVVDNPTAIHCFTCHAPHTNGNLNLRVTSARTLEDGTTLDIGSANICAQCHHARYAVSSEVEDPTELSEHWGSHHSPQADMLFGTNGYEFTGYTYNQTNHATGAVQDGCLDCHFKANNKYMVSGHSFNMSYVANGDTIRNVVACAACHADMDGAPNFDRYQIQTTTHDLAEELEGLLVTAGLIDTTGHPLDDVFTSQDSAGAVWNYVIVHEDRSMGIHNPNYIIDLLRSAIDFMEDGVIDGAPPAEPVAGKTENDDQLSRR
ncbi:MAG: hypothetical protein PVF33_08620 [Candidatus Latescibacterota bacterium]